MADTLPVELVYSILSWSANSSLQDASILCRISKDILKIVVPVFYHTIVLIEPHDTRSLDVALSSPTRGDIYRKSVRCVSLARYGPAPDLKACPNLHHIALFAYDAPAKTTLSLAMPTLTHLTIYDQSRHFLLALPLTASLTHLLVSQQFLLLIQDLSQTSLPNLTHFLTPLLTNGGLACERAYRRLIHQLLQGVWQSLRIIGLMTFRVEARKAVSTEVPRNDIMKMLRIDDQEPKIAVFPRRFVIDGQNWRNECRDDDAMNIWRTAERLIEDLRQYRILEIEIPFVVIRAIAWDPQSFFRVEYVSLPSVIFFGVESTLSAILNRQGRSASVIHERRDKIPLSWKIHKRLDKTASLPFRIGLKQNNIENLDAFLMDVSHPSSPNYGQHWTPEKVVETFRPSSESVDTVMTWLQESGIGVERMKLSRSQGWVEMQLTVEEAEALLDTDYFLYEHINGHKHIGCESYSLPVHVQPHVEIILPTVHFDVPKQRLSSPASQVQRRSISKGDGIKAHIATLGQLAKGSSNSSSLTNCDNEITPACLRALYNFQDPFLFSTKENSFAIVEYTPNVFIQSDLDMFFRNFSPHLVGSSPAFVSIDGGVDGSQDQSFDNNGESDLDLQYAMTLVAPQKVTLYQVGDTVEGGTFNNMLDAIDGSYCTFEGGDNKTFDGVYPDPFPGGFKGHESCGIIKPANVISTSYGFSEVEATPEYAKRQCNEYGKLGLLGVTFLYSSGDSGVGGFEACIDPVSGMETPNGIRFDPSFPATCPYVTAVGATQINPGSTVHDPESACDRVIFSGGGFSNVFGLPSYQESAVTSFLEKHPPPYTAEQFNNSGKARGFPDISANGANYVAAIDGEFTLVYGTSLSAPVLGSMITAINDARLLIGKGPVGFINPVLYSPLFHLALNDITSGNNPGCGTSGFNATTGWDPVTGLGTPNYRTMEAFWLALD